MTLKEQDFIDEKIKEIDLKLENLNLTEEEKQILLQEKVEYEEQNEEFYNSESEENIQYESVYFKYWFENCKTIDDVLSGIQGLKQTFEQWKKEGHELTQSVDNGYCFIDKIYKENNY